MNLNIPVFFKTFRTRLLFETLLVIGLCYFPLFYRLDALVIRQFDEARNAVSAMEMLHNRNWVVRYFNGAPDFFDVKPPLLIWLQSLSIRLLGPNELAVRMPSALAALLTLVFLIWYFHRFHNNRFTGYLAALVLVTSQGYIDRHMARTGDHDALLVLFTTMIIFLYYEFLKNNPVKNRLLVLISACLLLGVFTKSIAVLMILPGLFIMTFLCRQQRLIFLNKWFYICLVSFAFICCGYYMLRENLQPGYLKTVWAGELVPRYLNTNQAFYKESPLYYLKNLAHERFTYWLFFLVPALLVLTWQNRNEKRNLPVFLMINAAVFLIIISAGTYNLWYDGPLFPLLATLTAMFLVYLTRLLRSFIGKTPASGRIVTFLLLAAVFAYPGISILKKVARTGEFFWDEEIYEMSYILRDLHSIPLPADKQFSIAFDGYNGHLLFYTGVLKYMQGISIEFKPVDDLNEGDYVLVSQAKLIENIKKKYNQEQVFQKNRVELLKITGPAKSSHQQ